MSALFLLVLAARISPCRAEKMMGGVVTSQEWKVTRKPDIVEEFIGKVRYRAGGDVFSSDWALYRHLEDAWRARGNIHLERRLNSGDVIAADGDDARLDRRSQKGRLSGTTGVRIERTPALPDQAALGSDHASADHMEWTGGQSVSLLGTAHVWGPRLEAWADRADYSGENAELILTGGPPVVSKLSGVGPAWVGAVKADRISAFRTTRALKATGQVRGWIELPNKAKPK